MDGAHALRCARGLLTPAAVVLFCLDKPPDTATVHAALLYATLCALTAGALATQKARESDWRVRVFEGVVCALAASLLARLPARSVLAHSLLLHPWLSAVRTEFSHWHLSLELAACTLWVEIVCSFVAKRAPRGLLSSRMLVASVLLALSVSTGLLAAPQAIVAVGVFPLFRVLEALPVLVCHNMPVSEYGSERAAVASFCRVFVILFALVVCIVHARRSGVSYELHEGEREIELLAVDVLLSAYLPLLLPLALVHMESLNAAWTVGARVLLFLDTLFVPALMLGPGIFAFFHALVVDGILPDTPLGLGIVFGAVLLALTLVTLALEEVYYWMLRQLHRTCGWRETQDVELSVDVQLEEDTELMASEI